VRDGVQNASDLGKKSSDIMKIRKCSLRRVGAKALASIKAKTLILADTKDLLNPEFEPTEAVKNIHDAKLVTISPATPPPAACSWPMWNFSTGRSARFSTG
jgi:hypothetical protein